MIILRWFYNIFSIPLKQLLCYMGRCSYEIYLMQMLVFGFYPAKTINRIVGDSVNPTLIFIICTTLMSIVPVLIEKKLLSKL